MRGSHRARWIIAGVIALPLAAVIYTKAMARLSFGEPPAMAAPDQMADEIRVNKARREMVLLRAGAPIARYDISLGAAPEGHKSREGDERTPEGTYQIDWRNPRSIGHLSLHISYPNAQDLAAAAAQNVSAGGDIMIHALPNGWGALGGLHRLWDWTNGCIAVTNDEMDFIWSHVPDGTKITIE